MLRNKTKNVAAILTAVTMTAAMVFPLQSGKTEAIAYSEEGIMPVELVADYETITYDSVTITTNQISSSFPCFVNTNSSLTNGCAPTAALNVFGYYDRWYETLIDGYSTGKYWGSTYRYNSTTNNTYIQSAYETLYSLTKTNVGVAGTSETNFVNGMNDYVENLGLNISYTSVMSSGDISLTKVDAQFELGRPILLLCSSYNMIAALTTNDDGITLSKYVSDVAHVISAYGYKIYAYYKDGVNFRTDTYMMVTSNAFAGPVYTQIGSDLDLNKAWAIDVYE